MDRWDRHRYAVGPTATTHTEASLIKNVLYLCPFCFFARPMMMMILLANECRCFFLFWSMLIISCRNQSPLIVHAVYTSSNLASRALRSIQTNIFSSAHVQFVLLRFDIILTLFSATLPEKRKYWCEVFFDKDLVGKTPISKKTHNPEWGEVIRKDVLEQTKVLRIVLFTIISKFTSTKKRTSWRIKNTIQHNNNIRKHRQSIYIGTWEKRRKYQKSRIESQIKW